MEARVKSDQKASMEMAGAQATIQMEGTKKGLSLLPHSHESLLMENSGSSFAKQPATCGTPLLHPSRPSFDWIGVARPTRNLWDF